MKRTKKNKTGLLFLIPGIMLILALCVFLWLDMAIKPTLISMSEAQVNYIATKAMQNAVLDIFSNDISLDDFVIVKSDDEGAITLIQANTIKISNLGAKTAEAVQQEITSKGEIGIKIALGSATGSNLLSGKGPDITIKILPIGAISTDFETEFENAGINQTRYKIFLTMEAKVRIIVPLGSDEIITRSKIPLIETIIVGDVPQSYVNLEDDGNLLNLIPNE